MPRVSTYPVSPLLDYLQPPSADLIPKVRELDMGCNTVKALLADVPGNILKGHRRDFSIAQFVRFSDPKDHSINRAWAAAVGTQITTAAKAQKQAADFRVRRDAQSECKPYTPETREDVFVGLYLTYTGMRAVESLDVLPEDPGLEDGDARVCSAFQAGLFNGRASEELGDKYTEWDESHRQEVDALLIVSFDETTKSFATAMLDEWLALPGVSTIGKRGVKLPRDEGGRFYGKSADGTRHEVEHFGFRDGISGPRFLPSRPGDEERALFPLRHVLCPLRSTAQNNEGETFGSFLVYRKLAQDVKKFNESIERIGNALFPNGDPERSKQKAHAWVVGRFRDGTPLPLHDEPKGLPVNSFTYAGDEGENGGKRCPFHAHMRRMNSRGDQHGDHPKGREHMPVRRSIPYGSRALVDEKLRIMEVDDDSADGKAVGLLFMAFVSSIHSQFEVLVKKWANRGEFPWHTGKLDPLIGRPKVGSIGVLGETPGTESQFDVCVVAKGGVYLFAPPLSFFDSLKK